MSEYRKKPVVIEAVKWEGKKIICPPGPLWFNIAEDDGKIKLSGDIIMIETLEGTMKANLGDYIIRGIHGELYPCKAEIFEATYEKASKDNLTFGQALEALKSGKRVARIGWNGKGMWLSYSPGHSGLPAEKFWSPHNRKFAEQNGGSADVLPCITMKTADNKILMGWLASQTDMLAADWQVLD